jgi:hypothetical protein
MGKAQRNPWVECWDAPWFGIGVGVVIGAFGSLLSVKWLVVIGWLLMSIQILRHDFLRKGLAIRLGFSVVLSLSLGLALRATWKHMPLPPEPITRNDITEAVGKALKSSTLSNTIPATAVPVQSASIRNERLMTKNDIENAVKDALAQLIKSSPPNVPSPSSVPMQFNSSPSSLRYLPPVIRSVPPSFSDGQITGEHFGAAPLDVKLHLRVKPSAQSGDYIEEGRAGPGTLLGALDTSNYRSLRGNIIRQWSDTSIQLNFPVDYWTDLLGSVDSTAKGRRIDPPSHSDIQVCYQIRPADHPNSNELCGQ